MSTHFGNICCDVKFQQMLKFQVQVQQSNNPKSSPRIVWLFRWRHYDPSNVRKYSCCNMVSQSRRTELHQHHCEKLKPPHGFT